MEDDDNDDDDDDNDDDNDDIALEYAPAHLLRYILAWKVPKKTFSSALSNKFR